ncbi:phage tail tape measure protein [Pseudomonas luteola]|uniref:phage tail tape measure protein n=1 Tax=Pseudomonas luteola TaxID=47886 RepID=UPI00123ACCA6|nr:MULTISPECIES: phage tail tape measure protein [Pseudomonas]MBA1249840.1 phage tail tape measure protein [Pseudomonas zeshuii]QEU28850.1 phage tail tape measure protein [Pseudomonas luteola]
MASRSLGTLTLDLIAKVGGFTQGMDQAARASQTRMKQVSKSVQDASSAVSGFSGVITALATGATAVWIKSNIDAAAEIQNLAQVAGTSTTEFQKLSYAAQTVGISNDKLGDIFKDVNDKVGDFLSTGGGELKDFFDKVAPLVGVTADQFRGLSGPQALGLYINTLEKAGVNQQQMTFFLESIADDASLLAPIMRNSGQAVKQLGDEAQNLGLILSEDTIKASKQFSNDMNVLGAVANSVGQQIAADLLPELLELTETLRDPKTAEAAKALASGVVTAFNTVIEASKSMVEFVQWAAEEAAIAMGGIGLQDIDRLEKEADRLQTLMNKMEERGETGYGAYSSIQDSFEKTRQQLEKAYALQDMASKTPAPKVAAPSTAPAPTNNKGITFATTSKEQDAAAKAAQRQTKAIADQVTALQEQATVLGMTSSEVTLYKLQQDGATESQIAAAKAALNSVTAYEEQKKAVEQLNEANEKNNQETLSIMDSLQSEEEQIQSSYERRRQIILDNTLVTGEAQAELLRKLEEKKNEDLGDLNQDYWEKYLESAEENLTNFDELAGNMLENFTGRFGDAFESMIFDSENLGDAFSNLAEGMVRSVVSSLGQMAAQWLAYQAVQLLVGKTTQASAAATMVANASAQSIMAGLNAFTSTAAIPIVGPALAPAAATAATAATAPMVAAVSSFSLAGMAHDGIDAVPETGTWLLQKGERVTTAETSAKLDKTLSDLQGSANGVTVNLNEDASKAGQVQQTRNSDGGMSMDVFVANIKQGGTAAKTIEQYYGLRRVGR